MMRRGNRTAAQVMAEAMGESGPEGLQANVTDLCNQLRLTHSHAYDSRRSAPGWFDLPIVGPSGAIFAELKSAKGSQSDAQKAWADAMEAAGLRVFLWRPQHWQSGEIQAVLKQISRQPRPQRGPMVILVGIAGAGKSRWAQRRFLPGVRVSLDELRWRMTGDRAGQRVNPQAVRVLHELIEPRMERSLLTVVDNTNCRREYRDPLIAMARRWNVPTVAVVFPVDAAVAVSRQGRRQTPTLQAPHGMQVPEPVIREMAALIEADLGTLHQEVDVVLTIDVHGRPCPAQGARLPSWLQSADWLY